MAEISKVRFGGVDYDIKSITDTSLSEAGTPADAASVGGSFSKLNSGKMDLLSVATFYDGYYDATPSYTGTGAEGKKTGWGVMLVHVKKDEEIGISGTSQGGVYSAWLNSNNLNDISSIFSSANNDGTKTCLTDWLALSVRNSIDNYSSYNVSYDFFDSINGIKKDMGFYDGRALFELGNISISTSGWTYTDSSSRVRTIEGTTIHIPANVRLGLLDYSAARYYVGWKSDNSYGSQGWLTEDFVTTVEGDYVILITRRPESTEESVDSLASLFFYDAVSVFGKIYEIESNFAKLSFETEANYARLNSIVSNSNIRSINHRGYNSTAPENTLPAYKLSKEKGFKWVETDVRWTSDGIPVLLHDETINRTARNADGSDITNTIYIKDITYEQALTYDFGIRKGLQYAGIKIPTYTDFLALCRNIGLQPYIEIKSSDATIELLNELVELSKKSGIADKITYISDSVDILSRIGDAVSNSGLGLVTGSVNANTIESAISLKEKTNYVFIDSMNYTDAEIALCAAASIPLEVWTINTVANIVSLPNYISGVTSDTLIAGYELYKANMS